jgi:formiminotetrahydrofolate cyclodeaminase
MPPKRSDKAMHYVGKQWPRGELWSCSSCAFQGNFPWRSKCFRCSALPTRAVRDKALALQREEKRNAPPTRRVPPRGGGGTATAAAGPSKNELAELQRELAAAKKEKQELRKKLSAATGDGADEDDGDAHDDDQDEADALEEQDREIELQRKRVRALQDAWDEDDPLVVQTKDRLKLLVQKRNEAKPHRVRLRNIERKIDRLQKSRDGKWERVKDLHDRIRDLNEERAEAVAQVEAVDKELDEAKAERTAELQRAIDESETAPAGGGGGDGARDAAGKAVQLIRDATAARLPASGELGAAIAAALTQLSTLLEKLPPPPSDGLVGTRPKPGAPLAEGSGPLRYDIGADPSTTVSDAAPAAAAAASAGAATPAAELCDSDDDGGADAMRDLDEGVLRNIAIAMCSGGGAGGSEAGGDDVAVGSCGGGDGGGGANGAHGPQSEAVAALLPKIRATFKSKGGVIKFVNKPQRRRAAGPAAAAHAAAVKSA